MDKKIMICGASGTGKTTLAHHISEEYGIPFIDTSAKKLWPEFGFKNHMDVRTKSLLDTKLGIQYQFEVLIQRSNLLKKDSFVSDRSFVDNVTYMLMDLGHSLLNCEIEDFIRMGNLNMVKCDMLIFIRWTDDIVLQDDKNRIMNKYYQAMVDKVMEWVIFSNEITMTHCPVYELKIWDFETRKKVIKKCLELLH